VNGKEVEFLQKKEPKELPWRDFEIDVVVEATGVFKTSSAARAHIQAGAKRVVVTAPFKEEEAALHAPTVLVGVNESDFSKDVITSNASCTTNAASPLIAILDEHVGIEKAMLNTVHGYTSSQSLVDSPNAKDPRRGRAAAMNIVPSSTGASKALAKALPRFKDIFSGIALRVPVVAGSIVDITFVAKRNTSAEEVNEILRKAAGEERWEKVFSVTDEPLVSSDIIGSPSASIADLNFTCVVGGNLVKVLAWYDNEMGYAHSLIEHVRKAGENI
ncbi:MAG: type I glyceraldehyde-3-phosphate dehydrogenase, partial [Parcubacteria group bacterium]|nr:type I glyceraldehyde-3-phosphate dehydrogenase [Parcubacteria group bacterium]